MAGWVSTAIGEVPEVKTKLGFADHLGAWRVRWGIGRMSYIVPPGLFAVGAPAADAPVLVTANYKLSFDRLRRRLGGRDAWILVLDTKGVNVWCAAGKGTFGTEELVQRIAATRLDAIVSHRKLVLPQLGASGICAHEVKQRSGFRVTYGPVRASDLPTYLDAGNQASPQMRRVEFPLRDRLVLVPVELIGSVKYAALAVALLLVLSGLGPDGYSLDRVQTWGGVSAGILLAAWGFGVLLTPLLLPWLPGRSFAVKGAGLGLLCLLSVGLVLTAVRGVSLDWVSAAAWLLLVPAITSHLAMNFTGASTYTSMSGVLKEMRVALPIQLSAALTGLGLWMVGLFW